MRLRRGIWKQFIFFLFSICLASQAYASPKMDFLEGSQKHVSIDLRDSDIVDVLKFLAQKGSFNIYLSKGIQGRVSLLLQDVRISDILDIVLLSNGLAQAHTGSIVYVMTQEEYKVRYGEDYGDVREVQWLHLKYAAPGQVFKILDPTKSKVGSIIVDEQSGTIILMETPEKMKFMLNVIKELDQPQETRIFDLSYAKAADVATLISSQITGAGTASMHADVRGNQIIITALSNRMKEIDAMIQKIDRKTREVVIDTQIIKVDLSNDYENGINLEYMFQAGILEPLDIKTALPSALASTTMGQIQYSALAGKGFSAVYQHLRTLGKTKVLASPKVTVIEGEEAKILIGSREAYVTSTTSSGTGISTVSETISFIDVGISLAVSALINKDGFVTMKIKPEVSNVRTTLLTKSGNTIPIVDTTTAETRVMVKDGTTIVIGGLRNEQTKNTGTEIPGLAEIPLVGNLFKQKKNALTQSELIVFMTPHVIDGNKSMFNDQDRTPKDEKKYPGASLAGEASEANNLQLKGLPIKGAEAYSHERG